MAPHSLCSVSAGTEPRAPRGRNTFNGRFSVAERPGGQVISNAYDFAGRLFGVSWQGGGISNRLVWSVLHMPTACYGLFNGYFLALRLTSFSTPAHHFS